MKREIKVFIASPGDLKDERRIFRQVIKKLNKTFGTENNLEFIALGWEDSLASTGRRVQAIFNEYIDACDIFILALHTRWGQESPDAAPYSSYTEEEFHHAYERYTNDANPEIFIFFKNVDRKLEADPDEQLQKILDFKKDLEESRVVRYRGFKNEADFANEITMHLCAYANDELTKVEKGLTPIILPLNIRNELQEQKIMARSEVEMAHIEMAEDAAELALKGNIEFARQKFSKLSAKTNNLKILYLSYLFYIRTGDVNAAEEIINKWLTLCNDDGSIGIASAYGNLGIIFLARGEIDIAEIQFNKALSIFSVHNFIPGISDQLGLLGIISKIRGDYLQSEKLFLKALNNHILVGNERYVAGDYLNLGDVYSELGELDKAEEMYLNAERIFKVINSVEGLAKLYTNLAHLYKIKGNYNKAIELHGLALKINIEIGRVQGQAIQYSNLANLYRIKNDFKSAEKYFNLAIKINISHGFNESLASNYSNHGVLHKDQKNYSDAELMYEKALQLYTLIGSKSGIATQYSHLANIYHVHGRIDSAIEFNQKSIEINKSIQAKNNLAVNYGNLANLYREKSQFQDAEIYYKKALSMSIEVQNKENQAIQYSNLGNLYENNGKISRALQMYKLSAEIFKFLGSKKLHTVELSINRLT